MKIIIPMAGRGTRLRPHTLTIPKPLIKINGKTIVQRLIESLAVSFEEPIDEIAYIIGDFGRETEDKLLQIAKQQGAKGRIYYQDKPMGTAHAVNCAAESLQEQVVVAFADTLFYSDFKISPENESVIWTQQVKNPESFGVVVTDENNVVSKFVEKPQQFVSDKAIIGIYYFRNAQKLKAELAYMIKNQQTVNGEYQLTDALVAMRVSGVQFSTQDVVKWLDCGNSEAVLDTAKQIFEMEGDSISNKAQLKNVQIISPCYIANEACIRDSVIGPYATVGEGSKINSSIISNSIVAEKVIIENAILSRSIIGEHVEIIKSKQKYDIGSYSKIH